MNKREKKLRDEIAKEIIVEKICFKPKNFWQWLRKCVRASHSAYVYKPEVIIDISYNIADMVIQRRKMSSEIIKFTWTPKEWEDSPKTKKKK